MSDEPFSRCWTIGWEHLDANAHMRNTAYSDLAVTTRMAYFRAQGFALSEFARWQIGPVVRRDEMEYLRESRLLDELRVTLMLAGISADASRFRLRNEFFRTDGQLAARLTSEGGWLDLQTRKLVAPPEPLAHVLRALTRTDDFQVIRPAVTSASREK